MTSTSAFASAMSRGRAFGRGRFRPRCATGAATPPRCAPGSTTSQEGRMQRFKDKIVLVTGGARGQGRSHALHFAREGADIVLCDLATDVSTVPYGLGTPEDL